MNNKDTLETLDDDPRLTEDMILVPRALIGAACHAIDKKRDAPNTLATLRRFTYGDLSTPKAT